MKGKDGKSAFVNERKVKNTALAQKKDKRISLDKSTSRQQQQPAKKPVLKTRNREQTLRK